LLVCDDIVSPNYGTGQRLLAIKRALESLGECRILYLTNKEKPIEFSSNDYIAPLPISKDATRFEYIVWNLTFGSYRIDPNYDKLFKEIKREFCYDIVICSFFRNTPVVPTMNSPCLLDIDALDEPKGLVTRIIWPITKLMIRKRAHDFNKIFVIRHKDEKLFKKSRRNDIVFLPGFSTNALPNIDLVKRGKYVLMVGSINWPPNKEAISFLIAAGLPKLLKSRGWTLRLVGSDTDSYKSIEGVSSEGFVDNINTEYAFSGIVICPVWSGSGANIKLAEGIQYGCAVVSTKHSAEAYSGLLEPGRDFLVAENKKAFINTLIRLVDDQELRFYLEMNACKVAKENLTQLHFTKIISNAIELCLS